MQNPSFRKQERKWELGMDGQTDGRIDRRMVWMDGWIHERIDRTDGRIDKHMDAMMHGCTEVRTNERTVE